MLLHLSFLLLDSGWYKRLPGLIFHTGDPYAEPCQHAIALLSESLRVLESLRISVSQYPIVYNSVLFVDFLHDL